MAASYSDNSSGLNRSEIALWAGAAALVVAAHAAVAFAAYSSTPQTFAAEPLASAIMIDLAPMAVAPDPVAIDSAASEAIDEVLEPVDEAQPEIVEAEPIEQEVPEQEIAAEPVAEEVPEPVEQMAESEPVEHEEVVETVAEEANVVLPKVAMIPQPRPKQAKPAPAKKPVQATKPVAKPIRNPPPSTAAQRAEQAAPRAAAPAANAGAGRAVSPAKWQARVNAHLNRRKRFPSRARAGGIAVVRFTINPSGVVTGVSLVNSSGDTTLDTAAVELVQRSSPIPAPPPEIAKASMSLTVPINYSRR